MEPSKVLTRRVTLDLLSLRSEDNGLEERRLKTGRPVKSFAIVQVGEVKVPQ